jgi:hypothetical protein
MELMKVQEQQLALLIGLIEGHRADKGQES